MGTVRGMSGRGFRARAAGLALTLLCVPALAQDRIIFVNGRLLGEDGIRLVDELNCGEPVPSGNYWLDLENRTWGYVGVDGINPLPDCAGSRSETSGEDEEEGDCESRYAMFEDRLCYCHGIC